MSRFNASQKRAVLRLGVYAGLAALACLVVWMSLNGLGLPCLIERTLGFRCPACGATTALGALLRLDFAAAFQANPVFTAAFYPLGELLAIQDAATAVYNLLQSKAERRSLLQWMCGRGRQI